MTDYELDTLLSIHSELIDLRREYEEMKDDRDKLLSANAKLTNELFRLKHPKSEMEVCDEGGEF